MPVVQIDDENVACVVLGLKLIPCDTHSNKILACAHNRMVATQIEPVLHVAVDMVPVPLAELLKLRNGYAAVLWYKASASCVCANRHKLHIPCSRVAQDNAHANPIENRTNGFEIWGARSLQPLCKGWLAQAQCLCGLLDVVVVVLANIVLQDVKDLFTKITHDNLQK